MNREFYARMARVQSIRSAKVSRRPLSIWPGDPGEIQIGDLPEVSKEYLESDPPWLSLTDNQEVRGFNSEVLRVGWRYGIISQQVRPGVGVEREIGVWRDGKSV